MSTFGGRSGGILTTAIGDTLKEIKDAKDAKDPYGVEQLFGRHSLTVEEHIENQSKKKEHEKHTVSIHEIYNKCVEKAAVISRKCRHEQSLNLQSANCKVHETPWPLMGTFGYGY